MSSKEIAELTISRDFNGHAFTFRKDGWFNMTKAATHFGKRLGNFWVAKDTIEYIEAVAKTTGNSLKSSQYVEALQGSHGGTWAHPKLATRFAQWLDVKAKQAPALPRIDMHAGKSLRRINTLGQLSTGYSPQHGG